MFDFVYVRSTVNIFRPILSQRRFFIFQISYK